MLCFVRLTSQARSALIVLLSIDDGYKLVCTTVYTVVN